MKEICENIYKKSRKNAGLEQIEAADKLGVSARSLQNYESEMNQTIPPLDIVRNMCILYKDKGLAYKHIKKSPIGDFIPDFSEQPSLTVATLSNAFGYDCVKKGEVADRFTEHAKNNNFWTAFNSLENTLKKYDFVSEKYVYETDVSVIKSALEEFSEIITDILSSDDGIVKAVVKPNACKPDDEEDNKSDTRTKSNTETKKSETEEKKLTKEELVSIIKSTVSDTIKDVFPADAEAEEKVEKEDKSLGEMTAGEVQDIIKSTVSEEIKKYAAARGKATNLDAEEEEVEKSEEPEHYMHGIL